MFEVRLMNCVGMDSINGCLKIIELEWYRDYFVVYFYYWLLCVSVVKFYMVWFRGWIIDWYFNI